MQLDNLNVLASFLTVSETRTHVSDSQDACAGIHLRINRASCTVLARIWPV
jgi:hypothetical protein